MDVLSNEKNSSICYDIENDTIFLFWQHIIDKRNKLGGGKTSMKSLKILSFAPE